MVLAVGAAGCGAGVERSPYPDGLPTARASTPDTDEVFGFSDSTFAAPPDFNPAAITGAQTVSAARAAGATSHRLVYAWRLAEPRRGVWDDRYTATTRAVAGAFPRRTLVVLAFAPRWANPEAGRFCPHDGDCLFPPAAFELPAWQDYVRHAVDAFPHSDFEVWNEPNLATFWRPAVDPQSYARLVAATAVILREERSAGRTAARLVVGALAQAPDDGAASRTPWGYLEDLYAAGLRGTYDAVSLHTYPYDGDGPPARDPRFVADWEHIRAVVAGHDPGARLWVTETGATTTGPGHGRPAVIATRLASLVRALLAMGDVDAVYVHTLFEPASFAPGDRERGFGLIEAPSRGAFRVKQTYCAVAAALGDHPRPCP
jgi:hypothetical protein